MNLHGYTSEGIVLARKKYGEADRILIVFSKEKGKISLIAKGVRRPQSKKRGHIEVFNKISFQAVGGHGLDVMTEAQVLDDFSEIRKSLKKVSLAYYFCEVIGKITHENERLSEVYDLLFDSLDNLKETGNLKNLRLDFIFKLLVALGFWPEGVSLPNPDAKLAEVLERDINSVRVGKRVLL